MRKEKKIYSLKMFLFTFIVLLLLIFSHLYSCQLIVNVRNNGGDIYRESIEANTTLDSITLEFRKSDSTLVTQFIDGRNEVQIFRAVILPEEELGQTDIQTICFVLRFAKNEFISSDAMSKLRQKNPSTVRHPEENRPSEVFQMDVLLNVAASHVVSSHINNVCAEATAMTFARSSDLRLLAQILNRDYSILQTITRPALAANITSCTELPFDIQQPCLCHYDICVGWYPCGLKYCRGKDSAGRIVSYRCGIKTCSRCRRFEFRAPAKSMCIWDELEFRPFVSDDSLAETNDQQLMEESFSWNRQLAQTPSARQFNKSSLQWREMRTVSPSESARLDHSHQLYAGVDQAVKMNSKIVAGNEDGAFLKVPADSAKAVKSNANDDDDDVD